MDDKPLYLTDFENVNEAIAFAIEAFPNQSLDAIDEMLTIQAEDLEDGAGWSCMIGVCDICKAEGVTFLPSCVLEDEITGVECFSCGNFSFYPKEAEAENEM